MFRIKPKYTQNYSHVTYLMCFFLAKFSNFPFHNESKRGNKVKFRQEKNVMNPMDKNGKISRCVICDSKMHWAKNCPHKKLQNINMTETNSAEDNYENANIVLMTEQPSENEIFMLEALRSAILDTACINFCELLDESLLNLVKIFPTTTKFKFSDGKKADAIVKVIIPVKIGFHCQVQSLYCSFT